MFSTIAAFNDQDSSLNPAETAFLKDRPSIAKARDLILAHGWNSTSYQILNPGISRWFSKDAVVGFVSSKGVRVGVGAPVCPLDDLPAVAAEFERDAARNSERVCYFAAESRLDSVFAGSTDHSMVLLGAQAVWNPGEWAGS